MKRLALAVLLSLVLAILAFAPAARAAFPGTNGKIAFVVGGGIWTMNVDGSARTQLTSGPGEDAHPAWSPDGQRILFHRIVESPLSSQVYMMNADGGNLHQVTNHPGAGVWSPDWSPDGTRIIYSDHPDTSQKNVYTADPDGTDEQILVFDTSPNTYGSTFNAAWTSDGGEIAIGATVCNFGCIGFHIFRVRPDGSNYEAMWGSGRATRHDWSPDGIYLVAPQPSSEGLDRIDRTESSFPLTDFGSDASWAPDGTKILFDYAGDGPSVHFGELFTMDPDGTDETNITNTPSIDEFSPDWQSLPINGYARPKGATPLHVSLVPAYFPCAAPNRQHGPSLSFGSCNPPKQASDEITVGSADSNGKPTRSVSHMRFKTLPGVPSTPADEADVEFQTEVTDVYNQGSLTEYTGSLRTEVTVRITDKLNSPHPGGPGAGTGTDISFGYTIPCAPTPDPDQGSSCTFDTTADAILAGWIPEGRRSIWQLSALRVYDGGADNNGDSPLDNTVFLRPGIFVP